MKNKHLPIMGVGPLYVILIIAMTAIGIILSVMEIIPIITIKSLKWLFIIIGILCVVVGVMLWVKAVIFDRLDTHVKRNELVTTGAYAYVRNPVYSAFMFVCTGVLFDYGNIALFILPIFYWFLMTVLMKQTEEKWLTNLYGQEYIRYCKRVNRCIPWKEKKHES